ncbi:beta-lactamase family protein [Zhouia spongiae]|uniref:Beta-lactamase family protein n=1 Tax=Zhouia spongiae TaxID=2202721 RepID=A0ABY3YQ52_9FLAO|nr:serine hydrolase domain-containing protein [Zhouia spongiae]UNY99833.1 beta-lactamase family protein [Zhouia spongiae]
MIQKLIATLLLFTFTISNTFSQSPEKQFDRLLHQEYPDAATAASAPIAVDGEIIYQKSFGKASLKLNADATINSVFEIGSVTKQFTAVAIMMLAEQGKLNLDDNITTYFKDYPTHGHTITIDQILSHTSGLASFTSSDEWYNNRYNEMTQEELMTLFKKMPMLFAPGEKYHYSNTGYYLLGMLIEKVSNKSYSEFIEENIFDKAGMKNSSFMSRHKIIPNRATGHDKIKDEFVKADEMLYTHAYSAGAILSTTYDLYLWNRAIRNNTLISKESKKKAFTNYKLSNGKYANYGYGWAVDGVNGVPSIEHNGGSFGFLSNTIYLPEEDIFVVVLSNCVCSATDFVSTKMAAIALNKPYPDTPSKAAKINSDFAAKFAGTYSFDDGSTRTISFENNALYSQLGNRSKLKLFQVDKNTYQFENMFARILFKKAKNNTATILFKNRIYETIGEKVKIDSLRKQLTYTSQKKP